MFRLFLHQLSTVKGFLNQVVIQFAAVFGALSLASMASEIIEWRGFILSLVIWWAETARPAVDFIYAPVLWFFEVVFDVRIQIPDFIKDYLAVGVVLILSRWRGSVGGWKGGIRKAGTWVRRKPLGILSIFLRTLFVWPVEIVLLFRNLFFARTLYPERTPEEIDQIRLSHLIGLFPVLYAMILVIANWLLFFFPNLLSGKELQTKS